MPEIQVKDDKGRAIRIKYDGNAPSDAEVSKAFASAFPEPKFAPNAALALSGAESREASFAPAPSLTALPVAPAVPPSLGGADVPEPPPTAQASASRLGFRPKFQFDKNAPGVDSEAQVREFQRLHPPVRLSALPETNEKAFVRSGAQASPAAAAMMATAGFVGKAAPGYWKLLALPAGLAAAGLTAYGQDKATEAVLGPEGYKAYQSQNQKDAAEHPADVFFGAQLPYGLAMRPGFSLSKSGIKSAAAGAGINAGIDLAQQGYRHLTQGTPIDLATLATSAGIGAAFSGGHTALGDAALGPVGRAGERLARRFSPAPVTPAAPTAVRAGDVRFTSDGVPVKVVSVLPDGRAKVQAQGERFARIVTPEQLGAGTGAARVAPKAAFSMLARNESELGDALQSAFGLAGPEAKAQAGRFDAEARAWADSTGNKPEEYYRRMLAGVTSGNAEDAAALSAPEGAKGAAVATADDRRVIVALAAPDAATAKHELGHVFLDRLQRENPGDAATVAQWANGGRGGALDTLAKERFSNAFESWDSGRAKNSPLAEVFGRFKQFLADVYDRWQLKKGNDAGFLRTPKFNNAVLDVLAKHHADRKAQEAPPVADAPTLTIPPPPTPQNPAGQVAAPGAVAPIVSPSGSGQIQELPFRMANGAKTDTLSAPTKIVLTNEAGKEQTFLIHIQARGANDTGPLSAGLREIRGGSGKRESRTGFAWLRPDGQWVFSEQKPGGSATGGANIAPALPGQWQRGQVTTGTVEAPPTDFKPVAAAAPVEVSLPGSNEKIPARYAVAEMDSLIPSHTDNFAPHPNYDPALQPRDRSRMASNDQVSDIVGKFNPKLLAESPTTAEGAPVVGSDGMVESGNGRTLAIRRVYQGGGERAEAYRAEVSETAKRLGIDASGVKNPVLVRVREGSLPANERAALAERMGASPVARLSATEQARADARTILDHGLLARVRPVGIGKSRDGGESGFRSRLRGQGGRE